MFNSNFNGENNNANNNNLVPVVTVKPEISETTNSEVAIALLQEDIAKLGEQDGRNKGQIELMKIYLASLRGRISEIEAITRKILKQNGGSSSSELNLSNLDDYNSQSFSNLGSLDNSLIELGQPSSFPSPVQYTDNPRNLNYHDVTPTSAQLTWDPPSIKNPVNRYEIRIRVLGNPVERMRTYSTESNEYLLSNL